MTEPPKETRDSTWGPPAARFRLAHLGLWLPLCLVHGAATAWLAFGIQKHFAPLGVFSLLVGLLIGVTLAGLMRLVHVAGRSTLVLGTVVAALAAVFGQHYFSFQEQRQTAERQAAQFRLAAQTHPDLVRGAPPKPATGVVEYLRWEALRGRPMVGKAVARGAWAWASWAFDGGLTLLASLLVIVPASRQPYCDQCRTWFSTIRRGWLSGQAAKELGAVAGIQPPDELRHAAYRLVHCRGGCGPAGLELSWEGDSGRRTSKRVWIRPSDRLRLEELLNPET